MEGIISNYRRGRHHQKLSQMILKVGDSAEQAAKFIGKTISWSSPSGKVIKGKATHLHGRTGSVRVVFEEKGLPGHALGKKVKVE
jgi:large subunit ribosomal protein L35Ae